MIHIVNTLGMCSSPRTFFVAECGSGPVATQVG